MRSFLGTIWHKEQALGGLKLFCQKLLDVTETNTMVCPSHEEHVLAVEMPPKSVIPNMARKQSKHSLTGGF